MLYYEASKAAERAGEVNKAENLKYKAKAKANEVTDLRSFLDEIKYRWKSSPWLGGKPEEGTLMYDLQYGSQKPTPPFKKFNGKVR